MKTPMFEEPIAAVPSLSAHGFISTTGERLDHLLAYYFATEKNQSNIFKKDIVSFKYTCSLHYATPEVLKVEVQRELERYLTRYFKFVTVEVSFQYLNKDANGNPIPTKYELIIDAIAGDEESDQQRLYKHASVKDGLLTKVITFDNNNMEIGRSEFDTAIIRR